MYVGELHENTSLTGSPDIARGESKLVRMDLDIGGMGPANMLEVKFLSPVNDSGQLQICDINVIHVGANMPCVSKKTFLDAKSVITRSVRGQRKTIFAFYLQFRVIELNFWILVLPHTYHAGSLVQDIMNK